MNRPRIDLGGWVLIGFVFLIGVAVGVFSTLAFVGNQYECEQIPALENQSICWEKK